MPLPSLTGAKSIRRLPGTESASYQVETLVVPSFSYSVVFCTKVSVLYQDLPYFFCMAWIRSSVVLILLACATGAANSIRHTISKVQRIFDLSSSIMNAGNHALYSIDESSVLDAKIAKRQSSNNGAVIVALSGILLSH